MISKDITSLHVWRQLAISQSCHEAAQLHVCDRVTATDSLLVTISFNPAESFLLADSLVMTFDSDIGACLQDYLLIFQLV